MSVIIETSIGDFTIDLYTDERPRCCLNFLKLCKIKFYNFSLFHNVQSNLVAQTGDPTATGRGGESIFARLYGEQARFFDMEISPRIKHTRKGLVSMVNNGSGMHGSQFFITLAENLDYLDGKHTVFGEVAEGFEIIDKLNNTFCGEDNRPHQDIRIYHTIILDDPFDDPENLPIPVASPGPTREMLNSDHIPCDADIDEDKGKTEAELAEIQAEKEAKANTQILEMVGDLPSADVAPPENVLFVCKLNPVTTSEDLEIIFSRFGKIVNCDVIKDSKTGESLQYAFIEFENAENCESAYFKMDNVLIDDRRIHVDFSQSVSKLKWKGKGKGVDILSSGDAPVYVLKNQQRQDDRYDLVYEEDVPDVRGSKKTKQRQKSNDQKSRSSLREYSGGHGRDYVQQRMDRPKNQDYTRGERKRSEDRERRGREDKDASRNRERRDREEIYRSSDRERRQEEERDRRIHVEKRQHKRNEASDDEAIKYRGKGNRESDRKAERAHKSKNNKRHERRSSSVEDSRDVERGHYSSDSEDNSRRRRGRSGSRDHPTMRVAQKRRHDREMSSEDNSRWGRGRSGSRDHPTMRVTQKRRQDKEMSSDNNSRQGRGRSGSRDHPNMRVKEKRKQDRESSSGENNDKWTGYNSEGSDFSYGATRKDQNIRQDINSESDKETKRQKSKKSKKHKRKTSPDSDHKQNTKRKKKKLKHSRNDSDSD